MVKINRHGHIYSLLTNASWIPKLDVAGSIPVSRALNRVIAAALSLASTSALMILLKAAHPPAGATTLIISLGIAARPTYLIAIEVAVVSLVGQAIFFNKLAGLDYPFWATREADV